MQKFVIGKNEAGQRFDKFLAKYLPSAPKSLIYKMLRKKNITLNGKKATGNEMLNCDDTVESFFSDETFSKFSEQTGSHNQKTNSDTLSNPNNPRTQVSKSPTKSINVSSTDIVYEDENIILIDKKPGVLTQKAEPKDYSLNEWLIDYMLDSGSITYEQLKTFKPSVCNRLDRNTGGIVICGKSLLGLQTMTSLIRTKEIEKHYITICHGKFTNEGRIEALISKDQKSNKSAVNNSKNTSGRESDSEIITEFKILKNYSNATLLDVNLLTGKSHQIRAQLASFNNPIYGDKKYGSSKSDDKNEAKLKHQLLYAYKLIFPAEDKLPNEFKNLANKVFELPMPKSFKLLIKELD